MKKSIIYYVIGFVCDTYTNRITVKNSNDSIVSDLCHYIGIAKKHDEPLDTLQEILTECDRLYPIIHQNAKTKIKHLHGIAYFLTVLLNKSKYENTIFSGKHLIFEAHNLYYVLQMISFYIDSMNLADFVDNEISHVFNDNYFKCKISRYKNTIGIECPKECKNAFFEILATAHNVYNISVFVCDNTMHFSDENTKETICIYFI